jgi:hypothetical protein
LNPSGAAGTDAGTALGGLGVQMTKFANYYVEHGGSEHEQGWRKWKEQWWLWRGKGKRRR